MMAGAPKKRAKAALDPVVNPRPRARVKRNRAPRPGQPPPPKAGSEEAILQAAQRRARVWHIAQLIAGGMWTKERARKYSQELAHEWGVTHMTIRGYAAEASRWVDMSTGDRQKLVDLVRQKLTQWVQEDGHDRVQAARTALEHLGELRQNVAVTTPDRFEGWTEEQLQKFATTGEMPKGKPDV
jgi:predicted transcriptional regulator